MRLQNNKMTMKTVIRNKTRRCSRMVNGQKRGELFFYLALWAIMFAAPVLSLYVESLTSISSSRIADSVEYDWQTVWNAWALLAMFCAVFFIHNFLLAPLLVYRNRHRLYWALVSILAVSFVAYQTLCRPHPPTHHAMRSGAKSDIRHEAAPEDRPPMPLFGGDGRPGGKPDDNNRSFADRDDTPPAKPKDDGDERQRHEPPRIFGGQDTVAFIIMGLLIALNLGVKYYFKSLDDRKRIKDLERENLNRQLEYLKYQINPHFFMNTLNNIHALVLINPEQANRMIETLSRLMRYVLYEGNRSMASLQKEIAFLENYIELMRVRYTERVVVDVDFPATVPDVPVPMLLFATFVENAFKHGVSYRRESFVHVRITVTDGYVCFVCHNSRLPKATDTHGGVGIANAIKRLKLIYGNDYTIDIASSDSEYCVTLHLPVGKGYM